MKHAVLSATLVLAMAISSSGSQYWISYDASSGVLPELENWTRATYGGGDQRYFEDDALVLDGDIHTADAYWWSLDGLGPEPGELFIARWRLCVSEVVPADVYDPFVSVGSDLQTGLSLFYGYENVLVGSSLIPFESGIFHDWELRSPDMRYYELYLDTALAQSGMFYGVAGPPQIWWGDGGLQPASVSRWSNFTFGVVEIPEPSVFWLALTASLVGSKLRR